MILTTSFYDMNQKILIKFISKTSVDCNLTFASYVTLCTLALLHRLLFFCFVLFCFVLFCFLFCFLLGLVNETLCGDCSQK